MRGGPLVGFGDHTPQMAFFWGGGGWPRNPKNKWGSSIFWNKNKVEKFFLRDIMWLKLVSWERGVMHFSNDVIPQNPTSVPYPIQNERALSWQFSSSIIIIEGTSFSVIRDWQNSYDSFPIFMIFYQIIKTVYFLGIVKYQSTQAHNSTLQFRICTKYCQITLHIWCL